MGAKASRTQEVLGFHTYEAISKRYCYLLVDMSHCHRPSLDAVASSSMKMETHMMATCKRCREGTEMLDLRIVKKESRAN